MGRMGKSVYARYAVQLLPIFYFIEKTLSQEGAKTVKCGWKNILLCEMKKMWYGKSYDKMKKKQSRRDYGRKKGSSRYVGRGGFLCGGVSFKRTGI